MAIKDHFSGDLTTDQQKAVDAIEEFLTAPTNCFLLKGYAGTGKTFLMEGLVKYFRSVGRNYRLMAPTGRAAMIIGDKTKSTSYTIHKSIYNLDELVDDEHTFRMRYKLNLNEDSVNSVYLIDESSMISDVYSEDEFFIFGSGYLLKDLISFVDFPYRKDAKIIFIGDNAQLPPIGMSFSPALQSSYLTEKYNVTTAKCELKQVVRQKEDSGILSIATSLRESLAQGIFNRFEVNTPSPDTSSLSTDEFDEIYFNTVGNSIDENTIVITHSNKQAHEYNTAIRERFFPSQTEVQAGDVLMITKNNYNYVVDLYNGQFAKVIEASPVAEPPKTITFYKKGGEKAKATLVFRDVTIEAKDVKGQRFEIRCKVIDNFLKSESPRLSQDEQQALYVDFKNRNKGLKPGTKEFKEALKGDKYFNALQVKYGYAVTCHKAQGGEWKNAFVNLQVYMSILSQGFFRWAYTGITRAKEHLYSIGANQYTPFTEFILHPITSINNIPPGQHHIPPSFYEKDISIEFERPFLKAKYVEISEKLKEQEVEIAVNHLQWMERYTFTRNGQSVTIDLNYGNNGFTGRQSITNTTDQEFAQFIRQKISEPVNIEFEYSPENSWQMELYDLMKELTVEEDTRITNIINNQHCDRYFIQTDAQCAFLDWQYRNNGRYTALMPKSTMGANDIKLKNLILRIENA